MARCRLCDKTIGFRDQKYVIAGRTYCYPCMACDSCHSPADGSQRIVLADRVLCIQCNQARLKPIKEEMLSKVLQLSLPNPLGTRILMESGEIVKGHCSAIRSFRTSPSFRSEGAFIMTTRRIIYLQLRFYPITVGQPNDYSFECPLPVISGVIQSPAARNGLIIYFGKSEVEIFLFPTSGYNFPIDVTLRALLQLREQRIAEIKKMNERERVQVVMDFSWLSEYMNKGGVVLKTYKCPACGAATEIPQEGKLAKCNFCKTSFYAEDVFKKMKDLIG